MIILADDLSGAAEVAGIAHIAGHRTVVATVTTSAPGRSTEGGITVMDTGTRLLSPDRAAAVVESVCRGLPAGSRVFQKVDSVLRGNVRGEIEAALGALGRRRCLLVPANPSLGRTIRDGVYSVNGVPLHRTEFRYDPTHPALSSVVAMLLGPGAVPLAVVAPGGPMPREGLVVGEAWVPAHIDGWAAAVDETTHTAGAADFLRALLARTPRSAQAATEEPLPAGPRLAVSGTRSSAGAAALDAMRRSRRHATRVVRLETTAPDSSAHLRDLCAAALVEVRDHHPTVILVEGGATAAALTRSLGWSRFHVTGVLAPGVVILRPDGAPEVRLVIKPGSYAWPEGLTPEDP